MKILLLGNTTEGRELLRVFSSNNMNIILCTKKFRSTSEIISYITQNTFDYVIDTNYFSVVTHNLRLACETMNIKYIRLIHNNQLLSYVPTVKAAIKILKKTSSNILLCIDSKELDEFTDVENYTERIYVRMISMPEHLRKAQELGFKNLICMQGSFNFDLNKSIIEWTNADYIVIKDCGDVNNFSEEISAALYIGCKIIIVGLYTQETGLSFNEILNFFHIKNDTQQKLYAKPFFPFFFDLSNKCIIVVGGGKIAERRINTLVNFSPNIILISPSITEHLREFSEKQKIKYIDSFYNTSYLEHWKPFLVIASTNDRIVNQTIMHDAKRLGIPHIISDKKEECDVYFPAIVENESFIGGIISKVGNHKYLKQMSKNIRRIIDGE